jgi:hypothetical protein
MPAVGQTEGRSQDGPTRADRSVDGSRASAVPVRWVRRGCLVGFTDFAVRWESAPNQPLAVGAVADGVDLEFCVVQRSADGSPFFDLPTASDLKRVWLTVPMLASEDHALEGIRVRTLSPLALYQIRSALADVMGGLRPKDVTAQAALRARFFSDKAEAELAPRVEILTNSGARSE